MKKLPIFLILFVLFLTPTLTLGAEEECIEGDCINGQGTIEYSWKKYEGEFKNGLPNGQGSLKNKNNGKIYVGEFKDGQRHGRGVEGYPGSDGKVGYWLYDMYVGEENPEEFK